MDRSSGAKHTRVGRSLQERGTLAMRTGAWVRAGLAGATLLLIAGIAGPVSLADPAAGAQSLAATSDSQQAEILGNWLTQGGQGVIRITRAADGTYEGRIVAARHKPTKIPDGAALDSHKRPDLSHGLLIMKRLKYDGHGFWSGGTIHDPSTGLNFDCSIKLISDSRIKVHGYIGLPLLGRSQIWTRYRGQPMAL